MTKIDTRKPDVVLHQTAPDEEPPEPPVLLKRYLETLELSQEGRYININPGTIPDLIKAIRMLSPEPKVK